MPSISHTLSVQAPVGKLFNFVVNPDNWTRYVTSLVEVSDLSPEAPTKGATFSWVYKMMGLRFAGKGTVTEYEANHRFALRLEGKHTITESYYFEDTGNETSELKVSIEYVVPGAVLSALANNVLVEKLNEIEARQVLEKIKAMCEAS